MNITVWVYQWWPQLMTTSWELSIVPWNGLRSVRSLIELSVNFTSVISQTYKIYYPSHWGPNHHVGSGTFKFWSIENLFIWSLYTLYATINEFPYLLFRFAASLIFAYTLIRVLDSRLVQDKFCTSCSCNATHQIPEDLPNLWGDTILEANCV